MIFSNLNIIFSAGALFTIIYKLKDICGNNLTHSNFNYLKKLKLIKKGFKVIIQTNEATSMVYQKKTPVD